MTRCHRRCRSANPPGRCPSPTSEEMSLRGGACGAESKRPRWSAKGRKGGRHGDGLLRNQSQTNGPADFRSGDGTTRPHRPGLRRGHSRGAATGAAHSCRITATPPHTSTGFAPASPQAILGSGKDLLVFIHGFANAFEAAISRAAFNREWFASSPVAGADMTVLAFSWPSEGALIAVPPHFLSGAYRADQARAGSSGAHLAWFLDEIKSLGDEAKLQNPRRRVVLLAHSMGNFALAAGVQAWFLSRGATAIFDYAVLAAADEIDKSFELPPGARLSRLPDLAAGISVYYSLRDVAMFLSQAINLTERLGFDGPANKSSPTQYPPNRFRSINCTDLNDYNSIVPPDSSHQYYRRSPQAREHHACERP